MRGNQPLRGRSAQQFPPRLTLRLHHTRQLVQVREEFGRGAFARSARVTADVLMHVDPAMPQPHYMARGRAHRAAADALDRAVSGQF